MALTKPKKKKYPKKPKASATNNSKQNYLDKVKEIDKDYKTACSDFDKAVKKKAELDKKLKQVRR